MPKTDTPIIVALDYADATSALTLVRQLDPTLCKLKVGKELFTAAGPALVETLIKLGFAVFLDLKFHDIPTTVSKACRAASQLGVWMLNVHASGGTAMMQAAREGVDKSGLTPKLIAVTVLTSQNQHDLVAQGITTPLETHVLTLAKLAQAAALDGVVCSAKEAAMLRQQLGANFLLVTPGIRPSFASLDDQSRVVTPKEALQLGVNYLVIGRPITQAESPIAVLKQISAEINANPH